MNNASSTTMVAFAALLLSACASHPPERDSPYWQQAAGGIKSHGNIQVYSNFVVASGKRADGTYVIGTGRNLEEAMNEARPLPPMPTPKPFKPQVEGAPRRPVMENFSMRMEACGEAAYARGGGGDAVFIGQTRRAIARGLLARGLFEIPGMTTGYKSWVFPGQVFLPEP